MSYRAWSLLFLHLMLWGTLGYGLFQYAFTNNEFPYATILGSTEKDLSLPVFAQFIVTQKLFVEREILAKEITVPLYLPEHPLPIKISLHQDGKMLTWWKFPIEGEMRSEGKSVAHLVFAAPTTLYGNMELRFDGGAISHDDQARAPRLFTETFDEAYPHGNYRIANNEKKGDIALSLIEQKTNFHIFKESLFKNPIGRISFLLIVSSCAVLLASLPSVLLRESKKLQLFLRGS